MNIPLRNRAGATVAVAVVDEQDARLAKHRWSQNNYGYAHRGTPEGTELLHRAVMGCSIGDEKLVRFRNNNRLDCRRENLVCEERARPAPPPPQRPRELRGVTWHEVSQKWRVRVTVAGRTYHLGMFDSQQLAIDAAADFREEHEHRPCRCRTCREAGVT